MKRSLPSAALIGVCLGCLLSCLPGSRADEVRVAPLELVHPDEVVRGEGFLILADRRVFAVMAFLNAVGYNDEAPGVAMHPTRVKVRERVAKALASRPEKLAQWRKFYKDAGLATFQYMDFALTLSGDYPFRRVRPETEMTYPRTLRTLRDFPEMLNEFWTTAGLDTVWAEVKPDYVAEIHKYDFERMKRKMEFLWSYLRMKRSDAWVIANVPNLLDSHYESIGARYEVYYYSVESPGSHSYDLNIHEYLHSIINPLVEADFDRAKGILKGYYKAGKDGPYAKTYQSPVTFANECLVRALDHRMSAKLSDRPTIEASVMKIVTEETSKGLTLTKPFYDLLPAYETSGQSFDAFLPTLLAKVP